MGRSPLFPDRVDLNPNKSGWWRLQRFLHLSDVSWHSKVDPTALSKILAGAKGHTSINTAVHDSRRSSIKALTESAKGMNVAVEKTGGDQNKFSTLGGKRRSVIRI